MTRPRCGNDPRAQLTDDDRRAVEDFKAYLAERAALRDRIAAAIWERQNPGRRWADCEFRWQADAEADAAAVLAVLPPPADRAAILAATLREVLDTFSPMKDTHDGPVAYYDGSADIEPEQYDRWRAVLNGELRRMADETPATETPCWCGHPKERHWHDAGGRMTFPDGCHDCRGWNGAHAHGQELPWLPEGDDTAARARQDGEA